MTAGIEYGAVTAWLVRERPEPMPPFTFTLIAGGNSNLTYEVTDTDGSQWILRRPPLGHVLPTAHDMAREYRILAALAGTAVPVPTPLALCRDPAVTGAPFYLMSKVDGTVIRDIDAAWALAEPARREIGFAVADTLAAIHEIDPRAVGLGDLGRPYGYLQRQLKRWKAQLDTIRVRPLPELDEVYSELVARLPEQMATGLVHGDFRLENCIVGPDSTVRAVLDWELSTLGDPLADLGMLMVYWPSPGDEVIPFPDVPTLVPGFPTRDEMLDRYAERRGIPRPDIRLHVAFAYWRLACITEGVYARYRAGDLGEQRERAAQFEQSPINLGAAARRVLGAAARQALG